MREEEEEELREEEEEELPEEELREQAEGRDEELRIEDAGRTRFLSWKLHVEVVPKAVSCRGSWQARDGGARRSIFPGTGAFQPYSLEGHV